jgi:hypothetical protein
MTYDSDINLIIQGLIAVIIIGMFHTLWTTTHAYGGMIGKSIRLLGLGILFITVAVIEKMLLNFGVIEPTSNWAVIEDVLNLVGLSLLAWGFSRLASAARV